MWLDRGGGGRGGERDYYFGEKSFVRVITHAGDGGIVVAVAEPGALRR